MWDTGATGREAIHQFITEANRFTARISETETTFLDTTVFKGERLNQDSIFEIRSHLTMTETFAIYAFIFLSRSGKEKRIY